MTEFWFFVPRLDLYASGMNNMFLRYPTVKAFTSWKSDWFG